MDFDTVTQDEFERRLKAGDGKVFQRPWKDVGYHGGTEWVDGKVAFAWGRPLDQIGAHAGVKDQFTYVSTAGGAFLEWMEGKALPGVEALKG